jgi:hypothetical protein
MGIIKDSNMYSSTFLFHTSISFGFLDTKGIRRFLRTYLKNKLNLAIKIHLHKKKKNVSAFRKIY